MKLTHTNVPLFNLQNKITNRKKIALHNRNNSFDEKESSGGYQLNEIMQVITNIYNTNTNLMFRSDSQGCLMDELKKEEVQS